MELWGLKEGTYLFQLTVAGSDQPESTSNITVTVLSPKQTEGEEGGWGGRPGTHPPSAPCSGSVDWPSELPHQLSFPQNIASHPARWAAAVVPFPAGTTTPQNRSARVSFMEVVWATRTTTFGKKSASLPAAMCKVGLCEAVLGLR